ncbi:MAG: 50S ribosomal protein L4 [Patescibacteria group bacterium]|jgi:large subunit ribosomal protein L4
MKVKVFSTGKTEESVELSPEIFGVTSSPKLVPQVLQTQLANKRQPIACVKDRGEVSGGGKKPWKQKGTGNARAGSNRSPIWIGGGITFGPTNVRNFHKRLPQKMLQKAILTVLTEKLKNNKLVVVKSLKMPEIKTAKVQSFLEKLPIEEGKILAVLSHTDVNFELSAANLPYIKVIQIQNINILDLLKYDYLLTDVDGIKAFEGIFKPTNISEPVVEKVASKSKEKEVVKGSEK